MVEIRNVRLFLYKVSLCFNITIKDHLTPVLKECEENQIETFQAVLNN